ncbi:MAG: YggS family pyridoxal phosphate-dependent enzyme [Oxalobacteraceae bacterium]|jgi:pyridoxal phosphate enzyme (YggS family)|nr:YggS family pyridoxal phosphate-dependent enzyme [Oxalobacteraceae bacterium]
MSTAENIAKVRLSIGQAATQHGRNPASVHLLAVSKTFGAEAVIDAANAGQVAFGENYLQEAIDKQQVVQTLRPDLALEWHFIGPIQSNKTRPIAENFAWVHALDRDKIARRLSEQRPPHLPPLNVCLQVNVSGEDSKSGVVPDDVLALAQVVATLPGLQLRGLMAIPEPAEDFESQRKPFALLRALQQQLREAGIPTDTLSMGMSADMNAAIAEGATIVRIGTAIFGKRDYAK